MSIAKSNPAWDDDNHAIHLPYALETTYTESN